MKRNAMYTLMAFMVAVSLLLGGMFTTPPRAAQSETIIGTRSATLLTSNGITTTTTADDTYTQFFGTGDCYSNYVSAVSPATMTVALQHSPDTVNWVTTGSFAQQTAAGSVFTRVTLYGAYIRAVATVSNTNAMTLTVKCVLKNSGS